MGNLWEKIDNLSKKWGVIGRMKIMNKISLKCLIRTTQKSKNIKGKS